MAETEREPLIGGGDPQRRQFRRVDDDSDDEDRPYHNFEAVPPALIRLRVLAPLALVVAVGAMIVALLVPTPNLAQINDDYFTVLTPKTFLFGLYWLVMFVLEVGFVVVVATCQKTETRASIVNGIGLRWPLAKLLLAFWALFWSLRMFLVAEILIIVTFVLLVSIWGTLFRHPPSRSRPLDFIFIHIPMRMFLLSIWNIDFWHDGLLALHWYKYLGNDPNEFPGKWEGDHSQHIWIVFGVMTAVGLIDAFIVFIGRDLVWALGSIYLFISLLVKEPKPPQQVITLITVAALQVVAFVGSVIWYRWGRTNRVVYVHEDGQEEEISGEGHSDGFVSRH